MPGSTLFHLGTGRIPLLVIDAASDGAIDAIVEVAAALTPFPPARGNSYPGLRRAITDRDVAAASYARQTLGSAVGAINAAFGIDGFDLLDASFSMVTASPETLAPQQRAPHFDSTDPDYLAVMHYISGVEGSGTGFYRQRATGIEQVTTDNVAGFVTAAQQESVDWQGYIGDSNRSFERIGVVEGAPDRLIVYPGSALHSGTIPDGMMLSSDPRVGRLTANFFVRGRHADRSAGRRRRADQARELLGRRADRGPDGLDMAEIVRV